jgi:hypothetical protein
MFDMEHDHFADYPHGKAALKKMGEVPENFRLFYAGWLGDVRNADTMEVRGAEFRRAKAGKNKGKMTIKLPGTERTVYINKNDLAEFVSA